MDASDIWAEPDESLLDGDLPATIPDYTHPQAVFNYKDADGNLLYQNVRFPRITADGSPVMSSKGKPDKKFCLRCPNGKGGWIADIGDVAQVLTACRT